MKGVFKKLLKGHTLMVALAIIITSILALFVTRREGFFTSSPTSVIAPEFDFNKRLSALQQAQSTQDKNTIREGLLMSLAQEHIPIIMCAFHDLITGPQRHQKPQNVDEGSWLQKVWADLMTGMGLDPVIYMSVLQLRYSWFAETKDSFETFQTKVEPNFIRDTLKRYINKQGNFVPTSIDKYNGALTCKLYRQFNRAANLTHYMSSPVTTTTSPSNPTTSPVTTTTSPSNPTTSPVTTTTSPTAPATPVTPTAPATPVTPTAPATSATSPSTSPSTIPSTTTSPSTSSSQASNIKWVAPSSFIPMCLENKLQCTLFAIVIIVAFLAVAAIAISILSPIMNVFTSQTQVQPQGI